MGRIHSKYIIMNYNMNKKIYWEKRKELESQINRFVGFNLMGTMNYLSVIVIINNFALCLIFWDDTSMRRVLELIILPLTLIIIINLLRDLINKVY